jgi:hypothetical protein
MESSPARIDARGADAAGEIEEAARIHVYSYVAPLE